MQEFDSLLDTVHRTFEKCPWTKEQTVQTFKHEISSEAQEVVNAIDTQDFENLKEEIGDVIYDALMLATIAERDNQFTVKEVLSTVNAKIQRRKPWVFGTMKINTVEEAIAAWHAIKKQEKEQRQARDTSNTHQAPNSSHK